MQHELAERVMSCIGLGEEHILGLAMTLIVGPQAPAGKAGETTKARSRI
jgi:hypothetical protein